MKAIKALVIGMGILIVVGLGVLVWGLLRSGKELGQAAPAVQVPLAGSEAVAPGGYYATDLVLPAGARVVGMQSVGGLLALHVIGEAGPGKLLMLDPRTGRLAGTVSLGTETR